MSIKNKVLVILAVGCILLIPFTIALAKGEPAYIFPFGSREYTVSSKDDVVIRYGWSACSKGLVNDYIDATSRTFYFDGMLISNAQIHDRSYWGMPYERESGTGSPCLWSVDKDWVAYWEYDLGKLRPGDHTLDLEHTYAFSIIDGGDYDGDGAVDVFQGVSNTTTIIHVTP